MMKLLWQMSSDPKEKELVISLFMDWESDKDADLGLNK